MRELRAYAGNTNTKIVAEWKAPSDTGGGIGKYEIQAKPYSGGGGWSTAGVSPSAVAEGGTMKSTVTVSGVGVISWIRVRAVNAFWNGPWTEYIGISMNP